MVSININIYETSLRFSRASVICNLHKYKVNMVVTNLFGHFD